MNNPARKPTTPVEKWTLAKCRSTARKFENEKVWMSCKPASYKAAVARGFLSVCLEAQVVKEGGEKK